MKTTVYSQKYVDHTYSTAYTNISYAQSNSNLPKKSTITKKFEYSIALNAIQTHKPSREIHYHPFSNDHHNLIALTNTSPHIMKPKKPTQKPVQISTEQSVAETFIKEYQKIISNLEHYFKYYKCTLLKEIESSKLYFNELVQMIQEEKLKSQAFMNYQIKVLQERIDLQKGAIQHRISLLQKNNIYLYEKEIQQLKYQQILDIPLFQLKYPTGQKLREEIKKICFSAKLAPDLQKEISLSHSIEDTICLEESIKTDKKERTPLEDITALELEQMTPIHFHSEEPIQSSNPTNTLEDKDLYCDEDIENILKENKIVRKKRYECREDPIPEESESHEDSGIISQVDVLS